MEAFAPLFFFFVVYVFFVLCFVFCLYLRPLWAPPPGLPQVAKTWFVICAPLGSRQSGFVQPWRTMAGVDVPDRQVGVLAPDRQSPAEEGRVEPCSRGCAIGQSSSSICTKRLPKSGVPSCVPMQGRPAVCATQPAAKPFSAGAMAPFSPL